METIITKSQVALSLIHISRVDNTVYPTSLDLADTVKAISGNPAYAPYCKELLAKRCV